LHDGGFEFLAIKAAQEHFVVLETELDRVSSPDFTRMIAIRGFSPVLADILDAIHFHEDSPAMRFPGFLEDLFFRLSPVLYVTAGKAPVVEVDFFGTAPDAFMEVGEVGRRTHGVLL
jgi:hypothetical protein